MQLHTRGGEAAEMTDTIEQWPTPDSRDRKSREHNQLVIQQLMILFLILAGIGFVNLFYYENNVIGFAVRGDLAEKSIAVESTFYGNTSNIVSIGGAQELVGLKISGYYTGQGNARVYLRQPDGRRKI